MQQLIKIGIITVQQLIKIQVGLGIITVQQLIKIHSNTFTPSATAYQNTGRPRYNNSATAIKIHSNTFTQECNSLFKNNL